MNSVKPEVHEQRAHRQVSELAGRRAHEQAWKHFASAQTPEEFCGNWLVIQCHVIGGVSDGVVVLQKPGTKAFAPVAFFPENPPRDRTRLAQVGERALKEGRGVVQSREQADDPDAAGPRYQIAYPIRMNGEVCGVVGVDIAWRAESQLQEAMRDLQWGSGWLEVLFRRHADPKEGVRLQLKLALDLVSRLL